MDKNPASVEKQDIKITADGLSFFYGSHQVLKNVSIKIPARSVVGLIGPSGCGKSTLLRVFNRMNDLIPGTRTEGKVLLDGANIFASDMNVVKLRRRVGMVFQRSMPFPSTIYENMIYGLRINGAPEKTILDQIVEKCLRRAALWDEVKDDLNRSALALSGGQQQRLCIARALTIDPEVILMDEPCSALDPIATAKIEALIEELKKDYTIVIVTHNMQQAGRVSEMTAFLMNGEIVEFSRTSQFFTKPANKITEDYISGRFG